MDAPYEQDAAQEESPLCVAHFRRCWFLPTETFLHNTIRAARRSRPVLIGYERANEAAFPVECRVVSLYPAGSWSERGLRLRKRLRGSAGHTHFAHPRTYAALRDEGARVLHAHFGYTGVHLLPVRARTELPLITTFYGEDVSRQANDPEWRERLRELFLEGECFLAEGPAMRRRLIEIGCSPKKAWVQRIGIDLARYAFRQRPPVLRTDEVRLFFCASFREKKGLVYALEAFARAREEHPALVFRIAGDGPLRPEIEARIRELSLGSCAQLLGFVSHDRMLREMDAAHLFVQPSVTAADGDSEGGAPTTVLEAQACGLPVLASSHADIPQVVAEGESALLSPERDVDALAANLLTLVKEPERWAEMGVAGRTHVERFHDVATETAHLEELYAELAGDPVS